MLTGYLHLMSRLNVWSDLFHCPPHAFLWRVKSTGLPSCTFSEAMRSAHISTLSSLLWAAEVLCHDSEQLCCYRSHPHGCRVGHQLWGPGRHSGVVWEGGNKRQGGKFTLAPLILWPWRRPSFSKISHHRCVYINYTWAKYWERRPTICNN
jgi:hypothetical protein